MPERISQADISWNDELWVGRTASGGGTTTWTQVYGIEEVAFPERTPDDIDVTHQQSPGRTKETIPGMMSVADLSQPMQFWPADPSQIMLDELATKTELGEKEDIMMEMVVGGLRRTYRGYCNTFAPSGTVGEKRMANAGFKVMDRMATNPRVVAP